MILHFNNLANFTPSALSLILKGASTVTKSLSAVTISGNDLTYNPTAAEKTSLGAGILTAQLKITASGNAYDSEIIRLDANDLNNDVLTVLTLAENVTSALSDLATAVAGKVSKSGDTMTGVLTSIRGVDDGAAMIIRHNSAKGSAPSTAQSKYIQFSGSGTTGNTGLLINQLSTAGNVTSLVRANSLLGNGYSDLRVVQYANGTGVLQFYQSADATLNVSASGPHEILHAGNFSSKYDSSANFAYSFAGLSGNLAMRKRYKTVHMGFSIGGSPTASSISGNDVLGTLPEGWRPAVQCYISALGRTVGGWAGATYYPCGIIITTAGEVSLRGLASNMKLCTYWTANIVFNVA